ncbi:MAG: division/cell wall cluster transcriptional repressor MraZ [Eubacterium sp.]|nr:division/cell wall cluster transcriptional repressor MraZ [Eubacterium sp.]
MFMGTYEHGLDAKGRVIVPAKLREDLGDSFVITLGLDGCLFAYSMEEWQGFIDKLKSLPGTKEARTLQRHFMANAAPCELDKQGRTLIPAILRDHAKLQKDVVFVGVLNKIEIWSKEEWQGTDDYENIEDIAEHMSEFGLSF